MNNTTLLCRSKCMRIRNFLALLTDDVWSNFHVWKFHKLMGRPKMDGHWAAYRRPLHPQFWGLELPLILGHHSLLQLLLSLYALRIDWALVFGARAERTLRCTGCMGQASPECGVEKNSQPFLLCSRYKYIHEDWSLMFSNWIWVPPNGQNVENITFVAIRCVLSSSKCIKTRFRLGICPGPSGRAYDTP